MLERLAFVAMYGFTLYFAAYAAASALVKGHTTTAMVLGVMALLQLRALLRE